MRKVLMLHGFYRNASIMKEITRKICEACEGHVEFVFVDAPHILIPEGHSFGMLQTADSIETIKGDPSVIPRAWWRSNDERTVYTGLNESLLYFRDVLRETRFQGVLGFSQGAAMAAVLAAILERPELYEPFMIDSKPIHPPLEFVIPISGFVPSDPLLERIISRTSPKLTTPSLHIVGDDDMIVPRERSQFLISAYEEKAARVERHEGGHFIPPTANWRNFFKEYLMNPDRHHKIVSPSISASATSEFT